MLKKVSCSLTYRPRRRQRVFFKGIKPLECTRGHQNRGSSAIYFETRGVCLGAPGWLLFQISWLIYVLVENTGGPIVAACPLLALYPHIVTDWPGKNSQHTPQASFTQHPQQEQRHTHTVWQFDTLHLSYWKWKLDEWIGQSSSLSSQATLFFWRELVSLFFSVITEMLYRFVFVSVRVSVFTEALHSHEWGFLLKDLHAVHNEGFPSQRHRGLYVDLTTYLLGTFPFESTYSPTVNLLAVGRKFQVTSSYTHLLLSLWKRREGESWGL